MMMCFRYQYLLPMILFVVVTGCKQEPLGETGSSSETDAGSIEPSDSETEGTLNTVPPGAQNVGSAISAPGLPEDPEPLDESSPEFAVVQFLVAMNAKDERKLRQYTVPTDDFEWLLKGEKASDLKLSYLEKEFTRNVRALVAGDEVTYRNEKIVIKAEDVTGDRAAVIIPGAPMPFHCVKLDGQWKVDASELINARKLIAEEREEELDRRPDIPVRPTTDSILPFQKPHRDRLASFVEMKSGHEKNES